MHAAERTQELEILPRYEFVGGDASPARMEEAASFLDAQRLQIRLPGELTKSPEQKEQMRCISSALVEFGEELGVDVRSRLPQPESIHLLGRSGAKAIRERYNKPRSWRASHAIEGLVIDASRSKADTLTSINHDSIHAISHQEIKITETADGPQLKLAHIGLANNETGELHALNEIVTVYADTYVRHLYWPKYDSLAPYAHSIKGQVYQHDTPVGELLVRKVASSTNKSPEDIWRSLMRDSLTGDTQTLQDFAAVLGASGMQVLADYKEAGWKHANAAARQLDLAIRRERVAGFFRKGQFATIASS